VLFWRSRSDNRFNAFYAKEAEGSVKQGHWTIYWTGESDFDRISRAVKRLSELPAAFRRDSSGV
jgi:acetylglutamate kinase